MNYDRSRDVRAGSRSSNAAILAIHGTYTAHVSGNGNTAGAMLLEVYDVR